MNKKIDLIKCAVFALVIGIIVGIIDTIFGKGLILVFSSFFTNCWDANYLVVSSF